MMLMVFLDVSAGLHGQSQQEVRKQCTGNEPGQSIAECSTLIQSGQEGGNNLAKAYYGRGFAYAQKGDYDRAIQDYDQAIKFKTTHTNAFHNRTLA
jgi:tetratricopeptide (TPR) repeat protein